MAVGVKSQQMKKSDIYYNIVKVVCDPIEDVDYDELIAPENKTDLSALTIGDITVYNGSNALFTIQSVSPAKQPQNCKLNVMALDDAEIKTAIEGWINGNL